MDGKSILFRMVVALQIACGVFLTAAVAGATEIQLRAECRSDGGLILLGDLADVYSQDAAELKKLERDRRPAGAPGWGTTLPANPRNSRHPGRTRRKPPPTPLLRGQSSDHHRHA